MNVRCTGFRGEEKDDGRNYRSTENNNYWNGYMNFGYNKEKRPRSAERVATGDDKMT